MRTIQGFLLLAFALSAGACSPGGQAVDPQYLDALLTWERDTCACTNVPRDQADACLRNRSGSGHPPVPGGEDVEHYRAKLRESDRKAIVDSQTRLDVCTQVLAAAGN